MIETKPTRYFQIRPDDGREPLPAIELAESELEASLRRQTWSLRRTSRVKAMHLLLEDEAAGLFYVEVELPGTTGLRIRVMLEGAPPGFVEMVRERGIALVPLGEGEGDRVHFLETSPFV